MRKILASCLLILFLTSCGSFRLFPMKVKPSNEIASDKVPSQVIAAFQMKYPGTVAEKWFLVNHDRYVARFSEKGSTIYAIYTSSGLFDEEELDDPYYDELYDESDDIYDWDWGEMFY